MDDAIPIGCQMPGDGYEFHDVTELFRQGADELEPNNLLFMEDFTLHEAMSALEIGEPRLDSGLIIKEQQRPPFNPLTPLLPEEVCWILDRAMAYETEFHAGNFLAHTVHTLLYVHHLQDIEPDVIITPSAFKSDPSRPIELIIIVLRSTVQGLLKCCDLAWRELAKGALYDTEDWQSDKCDIPLLEGTPVAFVISKLDEAFSWVSRSTDIPAIWKRALQARILLRKTLLQVMNTEVTKDHRDFLRLIFSARDYLQAMESYPSPDCGPESPAQLAFDPYIGRQFQMATPIRVIPPPSFEQVCNSVREFLDGLHEVSLLSTTDQLSTWETMGNIRQWLPDPPLRVPYIRSLTQSTFYDGFLIMNKYSFGWMINQFFYETVGVDYDSINAVVFDRWEGREQAPMKKVERILYKVITPHIRAHWHNPPRRRRYFMKSLVEWQNLYDVLVNIRDHLDLENIPRGHLLTRLPDIALVWRLAIVREVILSGFQLELYADEERAFAYWYAVQVIDAHLDSLDNLVPVVRGGPPVHQEMLFQVQFLTALQAICTACFAVSMPLMSFDWDRIRPNYYRRYKWAFRAEYDASDAPVVGQPDFYLFIRRCRAILKKGGGPIPAESIELARSILTGLIESSNAGGWAGSWVKDQMQINRNLVAVCDNLSALPKTVEEMDVFDPQLLKWNPTFHPWFPSLRSEDPVAQVLSASH